MLSSSEVVIMPGKRTREIEQQERHNEQLRREASMQRIKISQSAAELVQYCNQHEQSDGLIHPRASDNPYNPNRSCSVL